MLKKFVLNKVLLVLLAFIFMTIGGDTAAKTGTIVAVGGGLDPDCESIYQKIIEIGGGVGKLEVGIIPAANSDPIHSYNLYRQDFIGFGVAEDNIHLIPVAVKDSEETKDVDESTWKDNALDKALAKKVSNYNVILFTGGSQLRITEALLRDGNETPVLKAIKSVYNEGGIIAGSSAGAAIMSRVMIGAGRSLGALLDGVTYKDNYFDPDDNRAFLTQGLGFITNAIIDQHFVERGRLGRLIRACHHKGLNLGIGIDRETAMVYHNNMIEVVGKNGLVILDLSEAEKIQSERLILKSIKISYLEDGDKYNLNNKQFSINDKKDLFLMGNEYYTGNTLNSNIFAPNILKKILTKDLVDNEEEKAVGIAFRMKDEINGEGVKLIFSETEETEGYYGDGSYAALNVSLEIRPIKITIIQE